MDHLEPDHDTLPNGKRLLDNMDSAMHMYYKEIVGSDTLKGGYITCYGIDDSSIYFYLQHGNTLHLLNQTSVYESPWGLGTLSRDFDSFFMTTIDNGNGVPATYQVFDKTSGQNILGEKTEAISYAYFKDSLFMLVHGGVKNLKTDSITLFNVATRRKEAYRLPADLPEFCCIQIDGLYSKRLKISFENYIGDPYEKTIVYRRQ